MDQIILDAEAGKLSAELARRGVAADALVHVGSVRGRGGNSLTALV